MKRANSTPTEGHRVAICACDSYSSDPRFEYKLGDGCLG